MHRRRSDFQFLNRLIVVGIALFGSICSASPLTASQALVEILRQPSPPQDFKDTLLSTSRSEDREHTISVFLQWRDFSRLDFGAEYDQLVIRDRQGSEQLRMKPAHKGGSGLDSVFIINGQTWSVPKSGSIWKSLKNAMTAANPSSQKKARSSSAMRLFAPEAHAAAGASEDSVLSMTASTPSAASVLKVAYLFAAANGKALAARAAIDTTGTAENLTKRPGGPWSQGLPFGSPYEVRCEKDRARGRFKIKPAHVYEFETLSDGSVVFSPWDNKKLRIRASSDEDSVMNRLKKLEATLNEFAAQASSSSNRRETAEELADLTYEICNGPFYKLWLSKFADQTAWPHACAESSFQFLQVSLPGQVENAKKTERAVELLRAALNTSRGVEFLDTSLAYSLCEPGDVACAKPKDTSTSMRQWLRFEPIGAVDAAIAFRPTGAEDATFPIKPACMGPRPKKTLQYGTCEQFSINPSLNMSKRDRLEAERLRDAAQLATAQDRSEKAAIVHSLRPLFACCQQSECRASLIDTVGFSGTAQEKIEKGARQ